MSGMSIKIVGGFVISDTSYGISLVMGDGTAVNVVTKEGPGREASTEVQADRHLETSEIDEAVDEAAKYDAFALIPMSYAPLSISYEL